MHIRGLIPRNFAEFAEAVLIVFALIARIGVTSTQNVQAEQIVDILLLTE